LNVRGLMNVQYAVKKENGRPNVYVLEVNPRASRTVPFVSKATGLPLAKIAARVMIGRSLSEAGLTDEPEVHGRFVKESVFPFIKFPSEDPLLGPEMRSTGEVMGVGPDFGIAFAKAQFGAGTHFPVEGTAFLSVNRNDRGNLIPIARGLAELGFRLIATRGTATALTEAGIACSTVHKILEGRPNVVDLIKNGQIDVILVTPLGRESYFDEKTLRTTATQSGIPLVTTLSGGHAMVEAIRALRRGRLEVRSLQEVYAPLADEGIRESGPGADPRAGVNPAGSG
jgi:carbamoyl-phosphate synthase large subunit